MSANAPRLLNDAQVQQFICDGFLVLSPEVPAAVHEAAYAKLQWMMDEDYNPGNNILPRVPEMQQVLDAPDVRGALASVLGADYVLHPHRFCHSNLPGVQTEDGPKVGAGSTSFVGWHQDSHSPLSKPRHHYPRYAMLLYYPQDTPPELGPTQLIPGTQYNRSISDEERARGMQASGPAGTCVLVHFDVAHGGSLNVGAYCRHMVKFVFARVSEPQEPSWNCRSSQWQRPDSVLNPHDQEITWQRIWHWLSGDAVESAQKEADVADADRVAEQIELLQAENPLEQRLRASSSLGFLGAAAAEAVPALIDCFVAVEPLRQNAIYALAAIGAPAIPALVARIEDRSVGKWSEGAFVLEDSAYALAAMGKGAMPALVELAEHQSEWIRINALFALGEMGAAAITCVPLLKAALADPSHKIVRTALDALGQMGAGAAALLPDIAALLQMEKAEWTELLQRDWNGGDQVRVNAALALLRLGSGAAGVEDVLEKALGDSCGYVDGFAIEGLLRLQTPSALSKAVHHLRTHRWDDTLIRNVRTF